MNWKRCAGFETDIIRIRKINARKLVHYYDPDNYWINCRRTMNVNPTLQSSNVELCTNSPTISPTQKYLTWKIMVKYFIFIEIAET